MWLAFIGLGWGMDLWTIPKLNCGKCVKDIREIGNGIDGLKIDSMSQVKRQICFSGDGAAFLEKLEAKKYVISQKETVDKCPRIRKSPWENAPEKVKIISTGERFKVKKHLSKGEYTLFDFGAAWCGPCFVAAEKIRRVLKTRDDLSVRAIDLDAPSEKAFDLPAAKQHLAFAPGIPWFVLYDARGKKRYEGPLLDDALNKMTPLAKR